VCALVNSAISSRERHTLLSSITDNLALFFDEGASTDSPRSRFRFPLADGSVDAQMVKLGPCRLKEPPDAVPGNARLLYS
jgi:hypothetical protein